MGDNGNKADVQTSAPQAQQTSSASAIVAPPPPPPKFKLHIDTQRIRESSSASVVLPNELHELGISVYDEGEFERGVLCQVSDQLAEYERAKGGNKQNKPSVDDLEDGTSSTSFMSSSTSSSDTNSKRSPKRKQEEASTTNNEKSSKRQRSFTHRSSTDDNNSNSNDVDINSLLTTTSNDELIRTGQMTPFGSMAQQLAATRREPNVFKAPATSAASSAHKKARNGNIRLEESSAFDSFLSSLSSKPAGSAGKTPTKPSNSTQAKASKVANNNNNNANNTVQLAESNEFDMFLASQVNKKAAAAAAKKPPQTTATTKAPTSATSFKQPLSSSKTKTTKATESSQQQPSPSPSPLKTMSSGEKISFMRMIEQSDDEEDENDKRETPATKPSVEEDHAEEEEEEYTTDDEVNDDDDEEDKKSKKKKARCLQDDGDEALYQARLKHLDKEEKRRQRDGEQDDDGDDVEIEAGGAIRVPDRIWSRLYPFQRTGLTWLCELHAQRCGGILGDEMGLGKTVQMAAFVATLHHSRRGGPTLIVAPVTLLGQWLAELHRWWPWLRVSILHEMGTMRGDKRQLIRTMGAASNGVLLTTYAALLIYDKTLLAQNWHLMVLDEGHKIRNPEAKVTVIAKCFRTPHRIILSGSPIQNNLRELWSLFDFVFPGKLGTLLAFMESFSVPIVQGGYANATDIQVQTAYKCACVLRDTIAPYLLRRNKADVQLSIQLPNKNEQVLFCHLSDEQRRAYVAYLNSRECRSAQSGEHQQRCNILRALTHLRKITNHVDIVSDEYYTTTPPAAAAETATSAAADTYGYYKRSGKMIVVNALLKMWHRQEARVLLFSQSRVMLDIIEKYVLEQHADDYTYVRMDGTTNANVRTQLVNRFNTDTSIFLFLLTTKVGGLGLNLIGANKIIIFDPDWNPSNDLQARERAWRIGQTRNVTIYRLLTAGTIEEKIYHRQIFKQFLTNKILKDPRQKRFFKSNDLNELFTFTDAAASDTGSANTETSALFAGTGSLVKPSDAKKHKKDKKKDKTKNKKDKRTVDGNEIPHLAKVTKSKKSDADRDAEAHKEKSTNEEDDDYVLGKLFKKRKARDGEERLPLVHTAMRHDKIVEANDPDFAIVEHEADKIAAEAVRALKESRKFCRSADTGIPNLTGVAPQFGSSSSSSLLNRIKMRKQGIEASPPPPPSQTTTKTTSVVDRSVETIKQIVEFFKFKCERFNRASTQQLVDFFETRVLATTDSVKFKSLLKSVCTFERGSSNSNSNTVANTAASGYWSLNEQYLDFDA